MKVWPPESELKQRAEAASSALERLREKRDRLDRQIADYEVPARVLGALAGRAKAGMCLVCSKPLRFSPRGTRRLYCDDRCRNRALGARRAEREAAADLERTRALMVRAEREGVPLTLWENGHAFKSSRTRRQWSSRFGLPQPIRDYCFKQRRTSDHGRRQVPLSIPHRSGDIS
jgi:hypothetical protein